MDWASRWPTPHDGHDSRARERIACWSARATGWPRGKRRRRRASSRSSSTASRCPRSSAPRGPSGTGRTAAGSRSPTAKATVALHDLTGFEGRCDAILLTTDAGPVAAEQGPADGPLPPQALGPAGDARGRRLVSTWWSWAAASPARARRFPPRGWGSAWRWSRTGPCWAATTVPRSACGCKGAEPAALPPRRRRRAGVGAGEARPLRARQHGRAVRGREEARPGPGGEERPAAARASRQRGGDRAAGGFEPSSPRTSAPAAACGWPAAGSPIARATAAWVSWPAPIRNDRPRPHGQLQPLERDRHAAGRPPFPRCPWALDLGDKPFPGPQQDQARPAEARRLVLGKRLRPRSDRRRSSTSATGTSARCTGPGMR